MMIMNQQESFTNKEKVLFGVDKFCEASSRYKNTRFGLVTNNAATNSAGLLSRVALLKSGFNIIKLFSPEHGLDAKGADGAFQNNQVDSVTKLPVVSLYGDQLAPVEKQMTDIDIILFDIPDTGCRFYTYLWTMTYIMEACSAFNKPLIILDRPNPISGNLNKAEGPALDEKNCSSFIGRWNIPVRHSCTLGELTNYFAATRIKSPDIKVMKVENWNSNETVVESGWSFVPTSPAIKDFETALFYPGMGLFEGINVNEGRGAIHPFKMLGAPWIGPQQINSAFNNLQLPGIKSFITSYTPGWGLYAGEICQGLTFSITDANSFKPVHTGLQIIKLIVSCYPEQCKERLYHTVANPSGSGHLDKLTGVFQSFKKIKNGVFPFESLEQKQWAEIMRPFLLYKR